MQVRNGIIQNSNDKRKTKAYLEKTTTEQRNKTINMPYLRFSKYFQHIQPHTTTNYNQLANTQTNK